MATTGGRRLAAVLLVGAMTAACSGARASSDLSKGSVRLDGVDHGLTGGCLDEGRHEALLSFDGGVLTITPSLLGEEQDLLVEFDDGTLWRGHDADVEIGSREIDWVGPVIADDGRVRELELRRLLPGVCTDEAATFRLRGSAVLVDGRIGGRFPVRLQQALDDADGLATSIWLRDVLGSVDQEATFAAGRRIRELGLATHVPRGGVIASGGVEVFLAGSRRTIDTGARLGVHSWSVEIDGVRVDGRDLHPSHRLHKQFLAYYLEMGMSEDYYWFVVDSAASDDVHWLTDDELDRFGLLTS